MTYPNVQWKVDNLDEVQAFLEPFHARCRQDTDDRLLIQAVGGLSTHIAPGDSLILRGDSLGILRAPTAPDSDSGSRIEA